MQHEQLRTTSLKKWDRYMRGKRVAVVVVLLAILAVVAFQQASGAQAAGGGPIIHWASNMIYAGQNNGNPWGPVGEIASVLGANFLPDLPVRLVLAQGDSNSDPAICRMPVATVNTATADGSGQFNQKFSWPLAAGQVNQKYSICALSAANGNVISHQDDGPFTVLSSSPPIITTSTATVTAGGSVIVTGQSWVPPQQVNVVIAPCADCGAPAVASGTTSSMGLNSGTFSITLIIPASAGPGNYVVNALTSSGLDANHISNARSLTVNALAPASTPTTTPTTTPSPTVTATTTATVTATPTVTVTTTPISTNTGVSNNSGDNGNSGLIIGLVVSVVLVLLAIAAVILFMYRQRSSKRRAAQAGPMQNYGQPLPSGASLPNHNYPMQQGNYGALPNNFSDSPTSFMQQGGSLPGYGQPIGTHTLPCRNCGRPLSPGDMRCPGCGMPVGTQNPNAPY